MRHFLARGESVFSVYNSTKELSEAGIDTAIVSVGATEQCGPHLPLHVDTLVAEYYARAWGEVLNAYVLPTMPFNTSEEHASFRGTVSLRPKTLMQVLEEVVAGLRGQGFRKQVLTAGHGGSLWLGAFLKYVNRLFGDIVVVNAYRGRAGMGGGAASDRPSGQGSGAQWRCIPCPGALPGAGVRDGRSPRRAGPRASTGLCRLCRVGEDRP
jgi:creatinine amidohydrolase